MSEKNPKPGQRLRQWTLAEQLELATKQVAEQMEIVNAGYMVLAQKTEGAEEQRRLKSVHGILRITIEHRMHVLKNKLANAEMLAEKKLLQDGGLGAEPLAIDVKLEPPSVRPKHWQGQPPAPEPEQKPKSRKISYTVKHETRRIELPYRKIDKEEWQQAQKKDGKP